MKIEVDITKTKLFVLLFSIILVGGFIFVFALPAGQVPNPGHSSDELGAPTGCTPGQVLQWSGTSWTCANSASSGSGIGYSNIVTFSTPGTYTWTAPAGVNKVMVEVWGAGGGMGLLTAWNDYTIGTGHGRGGYARGIYNVTPGNNYNIVVGLGGITQNIYNNWDPIYYDLSFKGGNSSFGNLISATGGIVNSSDEYSLTDGRGYGQINLTSSAAHCSTPGGPSKIISKIVSRNGVDYYMCNGGNGTVAIYY